MSIHMLVTLASYLCLLVLFTEARMVCLLQTVVCFCLGAAWMVWKKPWKKKPKIDGIIYVIVALLLIHFGFRFYERWQPITKVHAFAQMLHIPTRTLIGIGAAGSSVGAFYAALCIAQQIRELLRIKGDTFSHDLCRCLMTAVAFVLLIQAMNGVFLFSMGYILFLWNVVLVAAVILFCWLLCGRMELGAALGTGFLMVVATINAYVFQFRDRLFEPMDFFSVGTAMNVRDNYSLFPIPDRLLWGWLIWLGLAAWLFWSAPKAKYRLSGKRRLILAGCCAAGAALIIACTANLKTQHWQKNGVMFNGYFLDFVAKFKELSVEKPKGYSADVVEELLESYPRNEEGLTSETKRPHIIVVMDEAFADLGVIGAFSTNQEVTPFVSALKENAITGYALASVFGGNTANSEFEFLTGNSMAWLSPNSVPYQQYVRPAACSVVSYLTGQYGYRAIAMHPYASDGWNRPATYANLGFEECFFQEDFPRQHYIRYYISDQEMFEMIVEQFEKRREEPLFLFGVSMQNHGGYNYEGKNLEQTIELPDIGDRYPDVEQYLSLIHETDKAVEYLISYFERVDEEVVVVFFGDHQPNLDDAFYPEISEKDQQSLDAQQDRFLVPFFVWANYEIDEAYVERTSLNYLSSYMYEVAGIPLPPYNQFLRDLEEKIPAVNANGFYSPASGCYLPFEEASEAEQAWLLRYEQLQYNNLFDEKHHNEEFFPAPE